MMEEVNLSMTYSIYYKNICKSLNVPPPSTKLKINKEKKKSSKTKQLHSDIMDCRAVLGFGPQQTLGSEALSQKMTYPP
jgi:hypothetical protein